MCVWLQAYTSGVIDHVIHHRAKVPLPPQKSRQTASAGVAHTQTHTCEFLAGGFGGTGHSFLSPKTQRCFIVSQLHAFPSLCSCVPVKPPPQC